MEWGSDEGASVGEILPFGVKIHVGAFRRVGYVEPEGRIVQTDLVVVGAVEGGGGIRLQGGLRVTYPLPLEGFQPHDLKMNHNRRFVECK